jgi:prephenate dehydrogenase
VSHLPQLLSTALASVLAGKENVAGPAAADLTRLALSPYDIWRDIFATNAEPIDAALSAYIARLEEVRSQLRGSEMEALFSRAAASARALRGK